MRDPTIPRGLARGNHLHRITGATILTVQDLIMPLWATRCGDLKSPTRQQKTSTKSLMHQQETTRVKGQSAPFWIGVWMPVTVMLHLLRSIVCLGSDRQFNCPNRRGAKPS